MSFKLLHTVVPYNDNCLDSKKNSNFREFLTMVISGPQVRNPKFQGLGTDNSLAWYSLVPTLQTINSNLSICGLCLCNYFALHSYLVRLVWHLWHWVPHLGCFCSSVTPRYFAPGAWHKVRSILVSSNRYGTIFHPRCFAWQAWFLWYWVARLGSFCCPQCRHGNFPSSSASVGPYYIPSFCVTGVAQCHILLCFAWQA